MGNASWSALELGDLDPIRSRVYQAVAEQYHIKTACYPGSGSDVAPSLYIPYVAYIDQAQSVKDLFQRRELLQQYLDENKVYSEPCDFQFWAHDYEKPLELPEFDLLISQHAGNVGQVMKRHLRLGGILLVADGGEDADLAQKDSDYTLLGTARTLNKTGATIEPGLQPVEYFNPPKNPFPFGIPLERYFCFQKVNGSREGVERN